MTNKYGNVSIMKLMKKKLCSKHLYNCLCRGSYMLQRNKAYRWQAANMVDLTPKDILEKATKDELFTIRTFGIKTFEELISLVQMSDSEFELYSEKPKDTTKALGYSHRWVPVGQKLPNDGDRVLISFENSIDLVYFMNGEFVYSENDHADGVIAWMPSPKPARV